MSETDINKIMETMPGFLKERFNAIQAPAPVAAPHSNSCALAAFDDVPDEWEVVSVEELPPTKPVRMEPSIYASRGNELAIWRTHDGVEVVLSDFNGGRHYGRLTTPLLAEGGFAQPCDEADRQFLKLVFGVCVEPARDKKEDVADPNHSWHATCLWTNRDRRGSPHSRAFLIVTWGGRGRHAFPDAAMLLDGNCCREFALERRSVTSPSQPQWKGRAK